jgi:hypothetical protein
VPTEFNICDARPAPLVVADARRFDGYSQPGAEPSVRRVGDTYHLLYAPGFPSDVFVSRQSDSPVGPFDTYRYLQMPDGECDATCRVPIWQPHLDADGMWAFSYYDNNGLSDTVAADDRDYGQIRIARFRPPDADS